MMSIYIGMIIVYCLQVLITYGESFKKTGWYFPVALSLSLVSAALWYILVRSAPRKEIYLHTAVMEFINITAFFFLPLWMLDVKLEWKGILGLVLMILGILLIKVETTS